MQIVRHLKILKTIVLCTASAACVHMHNKASLDKPAQVVLEIVKQDAVGDPTLTGKLLGINMKEEPGWESQPFKVFAFSSGKPSNSKSIVLARMTSSIKNGSSLKIVFADDVCASLSDLSDALKTTAHVDMRYQHVQSSKGDYLNPLFMGYSLYVNSSLHSNAKVSVEPFDRACFSSFFLTTRN